MNGQEAHEKMLNISHQGNVNQNHSEKPFCQSQDGLKPENNRCCRGCGEMGTSGTAAGKVKWCSCCDKQLGRAPGGLSQLSICLLLRS